MKKANAEFQANPEFEAPPPTVERSKITITCRATVPTQQYGNITLEATQEILVNHDDPSGRSATTIAGLKLLKSDLALVILPLAEAEVHRCASVLLKEAYPDAWLQRNSSLYRWLRVAEPDLPVPAMESIIASKSVPNQGLE